MAATLVRGAFLSASVQAIMDKLTSTEFQDYIKKKKLNVSLLRQLGTTLLTLQAVLDDVEQKQIHSTAVKQWLDDLTEAIFDAEDLLNQISYDSLRCKVKKTKAENITNQVWNFLSSPFNTYGQISSQMKKMCERLRLFARQSDIYGLQTASGRVSHKIPSCSLVDQSVMVGRKDDKERLMKMLLSNSGMNNSNIGVVAILGLGGVGKTAVAQLLYNDKKVQEHFVLRAWVCVSEEFDILRVTRSLLECVTSKAWESTDLDFLRVELKQNLRDKRYLFVLDDLWNDNYNDWHELVAPFVDGNAGSRVIITTRLPKVAEISHTFPIHKLEPLSDEDCWSLLSKHALGSEDFCGSKYPNIEAIGRKIARKCGGLPIAAKMLGGLLRTKVDVNEWITILNSDTWNLRNDNILPALHLSYQNLPSHLKSCFAYCSIFPKGYSLDKEQMILLWMAEGFLEYSQVEKVSEDVGDDYFVELLSRSWIQKSNDKFGRQKFVMDNLVYDLATVVSGRSCCRLECDKISEYVRHFSYNQEKYDIFKKFEILYDFKCLRSFLPISLRWQHRYLSRKVIDDLLPKLKRLRVLSLSTYRNITALPDSIGSLVQLRYLNLSDTEIKRLPNTTCNLYNLQTLILSCCYCLTELPMHIGKLVNLRHLDISDTYIEEMPMQIVGLENLQTITVFVVGKQDGGLSVRELGKFCKLRGKLCIKKLHNVADATEAYDANLKSKEHIEELALRWGEQTEDSQIVKAVLDALQPSINLKKLSIGSYGGTSFPTWLGDSSFSNMVSLSLTDCEYCITPPPLGQLPSLKDLAIDGMIMLETIGPKFYGMEEVCSNSSFQPFPSLENLEFRNMSNWKVWLPFDGGKFPFPRLATLRLYYCPELRGDLPSHLSSIEQLEIEGCDRLLAMTPTLHWLSTIKDINIQGDLGSRGSTIERTQWSLLGSDSQCQCALISCYDTLLYLPRMILSSTCLQHLKLSEIPSLTAFPTDGLPISLQSLCIHYCANLSFLPPETWSNYTSLVSLDTIDSCKSLTSFPLDCFPALRDLTLWSCECLESIFISESSSLRPSTLQSLRVTSCKALRSLPQQMDTLTALQHLSLCYLPELKLSFSEGACLPPNLRSIQIDSLRLPSLTPVSEWGLQRLPALSKLPVGGDDIANTLLKERLLPISLVSLKITILSEMKSFEGNGLQHLSSLKTLQFKKCPVLESLPEDTLPSSLETLEFADCPRLESLPEDRLPSSLKLLRISRCPRLEARYESKRGKHWSNIAHIPVIEINGQVTI